MNQQENETDKNLMTDESNEDFFQLADLHLIDEEGTEIKGGPTSGDTYGGSIRLNHNETTVEDEQAEAETLDELAVQDDEQVKGGSGTTVWVGTVRLGNPNLNHNETTAEDDRADDAETSSLADLAPRAEQAAQITGGTGNTYRGTTTVNQGILTIR